MPDTEADRHAEREIILRVTSAACFLIFFHAYLLAPLIPTLARDLASSEFAVGLLVPAYMIPYGLSTLAYGPLSDRIGRKVVLLILLGLMVLTTAGLATASSIEQLLLWRVIGGVATGGVAPISLALLGDLFPYEERGRAMGWIFGAIAGGLAFGSTVGALLNPFLGWRWVLVGIAALMVIVAVIAFRHRRLLEGREQVEGPGHPIGIFAVAQNYAALFSTSRGRWTYGYILLNAMFHSGIFSWLGAYFHDRYALGDIGVGLALLGYGVPGMLLGPLIGRAADRLGRRRIIPAGLLVGAVAAAALGTPLPLALAVGVVTILSLGFDMSHPLLAGIVTTLDRKRRGQAMGMNAFVLFMGFGLGSLIFQAAMHLPGEFTAAMLAFGVIEALAAALGLHAFRKEGRRAE
ncbi:MAG TPA: MFS transporter [Phycisphaerae bacterium]|nr:MFS transporter [Phycisphaerae bacterium]